MKGDEIWDNEQAIQCLNDAWKADHCQHVNEWLDHLEGQDGPDREAQPACHEQQQDDWNCRSHNEENGGNQWEGDQKKSQISDFNELQALPNIIAPRPSLYTIQKIKVYKYVEL